MDCHVTENLERCTCTAVSCARRGQCCDCLAHHIAKDELPACVFPPEIESTYDRSMRRFATWYLS
jgi:hypothetical protein